jgi:hypothetical protein
MFTNRYVRLWVGLLLLLICIAGFIPGVTSFLINFAKTHLGQGEINELMYYNHLRGLFSWSIYMALILVLSFFNSTKKFIAIYFIALFPLLTIHNDFLDYTYLGFRNPENSSAVIETNLELKKGHYLINVDYTPASNSDSLKIYASQKWKYGGTTTREYAVVPLPFDKTSLLFNIDIPDDIIYTAFQLSENRSAQTIRKINIQSTHFYYYDSFILSIFIIVLLIAFFHAFNERRKREETVGLLVLIIITSIPLFSDFFYSPHDLVFHLMRIENLSDSILAGHFPVRMSYELLGGVGNAVPIMYPELFLYIPAILQITGASSLVSFKIFCFLINLSCVLIAYFSMKRICRSKYLGLIFSAMYTLCAWRLTNMYVRCAIGEALGMIFIPLVILGIYEIFYKDTRKWYYLVIGITGMVQSHIISLFLTGIFVCAYILFNIKKINRIRLASLLKAVLFIFCLNAWFIIPLFIFMPVAPAPALFALPLSSLYVSQVFATFVSNNGGDLFRMGATQYETPFTLGGIVLLGLLMFVYISLFTKDKYFAGLKRMGKSYFIYGAFALFAASVYFPLYSLSPLFKYIQYSWRFLSIASPLLCMAGSLGLYMAFRKTTLKKHTVSLFIMLICVLGSAYQIDSYLQHPTLFHSKYETSFQTNPLLTDYSYRESDSEYLKLHANKVVPSGDDIVITDYKRHLDRISVSFERQEVVDNSYIEIPLSNFRGYKVEFNDDEMIRLKVENGTNNFMRVFIPDSKKRGTITVHYAADGWVFKSGNIITCVTVLMLILGGYIKRYGFKRRNSRPEHILNN